MDTSLPSLERERAELLQQVADLGDLRRGSISSPARRCGKPACHCARPGTPGHQGNTQITYKVQGKTVTRSLPTSAARRKAQREIGEHPQVSAMESRLCRSQREDLPCAPRRSRRGTTGVADRAGKKTAAAIQQEVAQEVEQLLAVIFTARRKNQRWDLEALETATRAALHQAGAKLLEQLLAAPPRAEPEQPCDCGRRARYRGQRPKKIKTVLGEVEIERPYPAFLTT